MLVFGYDYKPFHPLCSRPLYDWKSYSFQLMDFSVSTISMAIVQNTLEFGLIIVVANDPNDVWL